MKSHETPTCTLLRVERRQDCSNVILTRTHTLSRVISLLAQAEAEREAERKRIDAEEAKTREVLIQRRGEMLALRVSSFHLTSENRAKRVASATHSSLLCWWRGAIQDAVHEIAHRSDTNKMHRSNRCMQMNSPPLASSCLPLYRSLSSF